MSENPYEAPREQGAKAPPKLSPRWRGELIVFAIVMLVAVGIVAGFLLLAFFLPAP